MRTELTDKQRRKLDEYRERYFRWATSITPGDRAAVETAVRRLVEMGGMSDCTVTYVATPGDGKLFGDKILYSLWPSLRYSLRYSLWDSLYKSISDALGDAICNSLNNSLDALNGLLKCSHRASLRTSLWDAFAGSRWVAHYSYAIDELGVPCSDEHREMLSLYNTIAEHCSAVWAAYGTIVILDKPTHVEIVDGKLISIKWGKR